MEEFKNWREVTTGVFVYGIAAHARYEIIVSFQFEGQDVMNAEATLYVTGSYEETRYSDGFFSREELFKGKVKDCLQAAIDDMKGGCQE